MIDIDGVLGDFVGAMSDWTAEHKHIYNLHDPDTYYFSDDRQWSRAYQSRNDFMSSLQSAILDGIYTREPVIKDSVNVVNRLHDTDEIIIATDRSYDNTLVNNVAARTTEQWLDSNDYHYDKLIITGHKELVDADVFIEDSPYNIAAILQSGRPTIRMNHPYNVNCDSTFAMDTWNPDIIEECRKRIRK